MVSLLVLAAATAAPAMPAPQDELQQVPTAPAPTTPAQPPRVTLPVPPTAPTDLSKAAVENPPMGSDVQLQRTPRAQALPYDEDYSDFADPAKRKGLWANLKYIPLTDASYLTLGGELRWRFELRNEERFGGGKQDDDGNFEQRIRVWADLHLGDHLRVFGELKSGLQAGYSGQQLVSDKKTIDLAQAFIEVHAPAGDGTLSFRVGRQEIGIGGFRLFDMRDGPNVRRSFDAARIRYTRGPWDAEVLGGFTITETTTAFDNSTNYDAPFWGARVARDMGWMLSGARLEGLWVHTRRPIAKYDAGAAAEDRDTFSLRFSGKHEKLEWDVEGIGQTGHWGQQTVRAGFLTAYASYGLSLPAAPRLGMRFEIGSGDKNKSDNRMNTYYQLFARPLTINGELGRANLITVGPTATITPMKKLTVDATVMGLWRTSRQDGLYGAPGQLIINADEGTARQVGVRGTLGARYAISPFWVVGTYYNHVQKGRFLNQVPDGHNLDYFNMFTTLRF
ncbi:alginate export family protein [Novosphingobium sp. BL-8A]|uniref:alginate export family protein n=1 Tax=Novosphingobium sp. BL-8A TaxID=3127639 RepID=UPI003756B56F